MKCGYEYCDNECKNGVCAECLGALANAEFHRSRDFQATKNHVAENPDLMPHYRVAKEKP